MVSKTIEIDGTTVKVTKNGDDLLVEEVDEFYDYLEDNHLGFANFDSVLSDPNSREAGFRDADMALVREDCSHVPKTYMQELESDPSVKLSWVAYDEEHADMIVGVYDFRDE